jgi:hypothetical protein
MPVLFRDRDLAELERVRRNQNQLHLHCLITGMRQVGKTALANEYVARLRREQGIPSIAIQGAHVTTPAIFFRSVYEGLIDSLTSSSVASTSLGQVTEAVARAGSESLTALLPTYARTWEGGSDPSALVQAAWRLPERLGAELGKSVVVVLDEVHEVFHQFARTAPYKGGGGVSKAAWDARGQIQHSERGLWVFTTSLRAVVSLFFQSDVAPFYLQTREIRLAPLPASEARALAVALADPDARPTDEALDTLAELSGGLPGILIQLLADCPPEAGKAEVEAAIEVSLRRGRLAALYSNIATGLSRAERHGSNLLLQVLHAIARGSHTSNAIARRLAITPPYASNLLVSLEQLELIEKVDRRTRRLKYPLMREWLLAQPAPPIGREASDQELRAQLGFGFEARVREALRALRTPVEIADTAEGDYLLRPGVRITLGPFARVERHPGPPEIDVIALEEGRTLVMGCRCRREHTSGETIRDFAANQVAFAAQRYPNVWGMYVSASGFTQGAVQEAATHGIHLLTLEGLNLVARRAGQQPFAAP